MAGLCWSAVAIVGRPMASALRKEIATPRAGKAVSHAEQVGEVGGLRFEAEDDQVQVDVDDDVDVDDVVDVDDDDDDDDEYDDW